MLSGTSFFNPTIFRKSLSRVWPLWVGYIAVWILALPVMMWNRFVACQGAPVTNIREMLDAYANGVANNSGVGVVICFIAVAIVACFMFSFMYSQRGVSMVASLPVKRTGVFISAYLAGLAMLLSGPVLAYLITAGLEAAWGIGTVAFIFKCLWKTTIQIILFYGIACLCAMLTGNAVVMLCVYAVLNLAAVVLQGVVTYIISVLIYGITNDYAYGVTALSPAAKLIDSDIGWWMYYVYLAAGVALTAAAIVLYCRRRMETASDVVAIKCLKPVFRYCFAVGCALVLGAGAFSVFFSSAVESEAQRAVILTILALVFAVAGYIAAEMMMEKSFRVFGKWKGCAVLCVVLVLAVVLIKTDVFGVERYVPQASEVESVALAYNSEISETENIQKCVALHQRIIQEKNLSHGSDAAETYVKFEYTLKNGKTVRRWYSIDVDWDEINSPGTTAQLLDSVINSTEAVLSRYAIPDDTDVKYGNIYGNDESTYGYYSIDITEQELRDMYRTAIYPDILDGNIGKCYSDYDKATFYYCYINWASFEDDDYNWHDLQVTASATRTLEYLKSMGITPELYEE